MAHDYTKDDVPYGPEAAEDYTIGDVVAARDANEIEKNENFTDVPPGDHLLIVSGFEFANKDGANKANFYSVMLDGRKTSYQSVGVRVRFHLAGTPNCTVSDLFMLPPADPREIPAYFNGLAEGKQKPGWSASKFIHFINRLGFAWAVGQKLPDDAKVLRNWKGRVIHATVEAGKPWTDDKGVTKPGRNQIKTSLIGPHPRWRLEFRRPSRWVRMAASVSRLPLPPGAMPGWTICRALDAEPGPRKPGTFPNSLTRLLIRPEVVLDPVSPEALNAMGNCCLAISTAITELTKAGLSDLTAQLVDELARNSRSLRSFIREQAYEHVGDSSVNAAEWMREYLNGTVKLAAEVIKEGTKAGLSKAQIFEAREVLKLHVTKVKSGLQQWSLPV